MDHRTATQPAETLTTSVIVIARNAERHIAEALGSIAASTLRPDEVVVVDGDSTDATREIAARFDFVRIVRQQSKGISHAYNEGIASTTGTLIAFLSADDRWMPDKHERQVAAFRGDPTLDMVACHVQHVLEPGCEIPPGFRASLLDAPVPAFIMETVLIRREAFSRVGVFDPALGVSGDTDWFARARDAGLHSSVLPETLVWKRVHDRNSSLNESDINTLLLRAMRGSLARKRTAIPGSE